MREPVLSKKIGLIVLAILVLIDAFLDVIRGVEGNPLWIPIVNMIGIKNVPFLAPFVFKGAKVVAKAEVLTNAAFFLIIFVIWLRLILLI